MRITIIQLRRCDLVKAAGRIDSETVGDLAEIFDFINDAGRFKIVFNMNQVEFISSAGLGELITRQKTCKRYNRGELVLAEVPDKIHEVMNLTGLKRMFKTYKSETNAVGSF
jgi:anti-sigma B factor antagonist